MDGEVQEYSKIADYNPDVLEDALEKDIRDLVAFLINQANTTGRPVAIHAYTDRAHFKETIRSSLQRLVPPRFQKALDHFAERMEEIATPIFNPKNPSAPVRLALNIDDRPMIDPLTPNAPMAYAHGRINKYDVRHGISSPANVWGVDPELEETEPGFLMIASLAFVDPTDRQEDLNKPGGNMWMFNDKELNEMAEQRAEQMRRLTPKLEPRPSRGAEKLSEAEETFKAGGDPEEEETETETETVGMEAVGAAVLERLREERRRHEETTRQEREQGERMQQQKERDAKTFEDNKRREEQLAEMRRLNDERFGQMQESTIAAIEARRRADEEYFRKEEDIESRRRQQEQQQIAYEDMEANNGAAEAIARLEATFGLIHEVEGEISEHPHAAPTLEVLGGEIMALKRFLASGRGSQALRARAAADVLRGTEYGAEFARLRRDAEAAEAQGEMANESAIAAAVARVEAELALVRANEESERLNPEGSAEVAALRAAENELAGLLAEGALGERATADFEVGQEELSDVMQPVEARRRAADEAMAGRAADTAAAQAQQVEAALQVAEEAAQALNDAGQDAQAERLRLATEALAHAGETTGAEVAGAAVEPAVVAEPGAVAEAGAGTEPNAGVPEVAESVAGAEVEPVATAGAETAEAAAPAAGGGETPATGEGTEAGDALDQAPSEARSPSIVKEEIIDEMVEAAQEEFARPIQNMEPTPAFTSETEPVAETGGAEAPERPPFMEEEEAEADTVAAAGTEETVAPAAQTPPPAAAAEVEPAATAEPAPQTGRGVVRDAVEDHMVETVQEDLARPIQQMQPTPEGEQPVSLTPSQSPPGAGQEPAEGEPAATAPPEPSEPQPASTAPPEPTESQPPAAAPQPADTSQSAEPEPRTEPSERRGSRIVSEVAKEKLVEAGKQNILPPVEDTVAPAQPGGEAQKPSDDAVGRAAEAAVRDDHAAAEASHKVAEQTQVDETLFAQDLANQRKPPVPTMQSHAEQPPESRQPKQPSETPDKGVGETVRHHVAEKAVKGALAPPPAETPPQAAPQTQRQAPPAKAAKPPSEMPDKSVGETVRRHVAEKAVKGALAMPPAETPQETAPEEQPQAPPTKTRRGQGSGGGPAKRTAPHARTQAALPRRARAQPQPPAAKKAPSAPPPKNQYAQPQKRRSQQAAPAARSSRSAPRAAPAAKRSTPRGVNRQPSQRRRRAYANLPKPEPEPEPE